MFIFHLRSELELLLTVATVLHTIIDKLAITVVAATPSAVSSHNDSPDCSIAIANMSSEVDLSCPCGCLINRCCRYTFLLHPPAHLLRFLGTRGAGLH